jgi:hypothetical protein
MVALLRHRLLRRAPRPEAVAVLTECRVPPRLEAAAVVVDAEPGRVEFARDSPLEEAVMSEPVSEGAPFPGNWEKYRETHRTHRTSVPDLRQYQWFTSQIP